ncbi:hypothetical protein PICSAR222_04172 [Mycobacterium avium subsp. paratuberculosis]|nr:hypothetical protein PICSAR222_04172 [Mycobacterium avium subsp. paratuberculosis]
MKGSSSVLTEPGRAGVPLASTSGLPVSASAAPSASIARASSAIASPTSLKSCEKAR